jgi:hypothetical protein
MALVKRSNDGIRDYSAYVQQNQEGGPLYGVRYWWNLQVAGVELQVNRHVYLHAVTVDMEGLQRTSIETLVNRRAIHF